MSISDASTAQLLQQLRPNLKTLWLADENSGGIWPTLAAYAPTLSVMTNRFDLARAAQCHHIPTVFNDWQFEEGQQFDAVFLRICKEKPVNLHLLREACSHLNTGGTLLVAGEKNEGIKSVWEYACGIFGRDARLKKHGQAYAGTLEKTANSGDADNSYHQIQHIGNWDDQPIYSKPGVYGWDKIDAGSALLLKHLYEETRLWERANSMLDLGCGYGFLTLASAWLPCAKRVATDNNAGALLCMAKNAQERKMAVEIIAADKGDLAEGKFDLILCNPPFHRGFDVDSDLTRDFLVAAKQKLAADGVAVFVVNSFIALDKKIGGLFTSCRLLVDNRQFKVLALS